MREQTKIVTLEFRTSATNKELKGASWWAGTLANGAAGENLLLEMRQVEVIGLLRKSAKKTRRRKA